MPSLQDILGSIPAEHLDTDLASAGIATCDVGPPPHVTLTYPYPSKSVAKKAAEAITEAASQAGIEGVTVTAKTQIARRVTQGGVERVEGVRNVIAVASAKGGVGKSMVAANLALALQAEGARTGLLDADIHGPSQPVLLGGGRAEVNDEGLLVPHQLHGVQALSMGHLVDPDQAVVWRGPMVVKALRQLVRETAWDDLDFLVLDLPPGTGDIQLSLAQSTPIAGAVIVTTPQSLAIADAARGISMFSKVSVPVLGYVANMASFTCPDCGKTHAIFGAGAAREFGQKHGLQLLQELPLDPALGAAADDGTPAFAAKPDGQLALLFRQLAAKTGAALAGRDIDRGVAFNVVAKDSGQS